MDLHTWQEQAKRCQNFIDRKITNGEHIELNPSHAYQSLGINQFCFTQTQGGYNILYLDGAKDQQKHLDALRFLGLAYQDIVTIMFVNCEPTQSVLLSLQNRHWTVNSLSFCGCKLEKLAPDKMLCSFFQNLLSLQITSDQVGNKGLKRLGLFDLSNLIFLQIGNTAVTTDALKVISKASSKLGGISFLEQKHFSYDLLFAKVADLNLRKTASHGLTVNGSFGLDSFVYLGRLSKAYIYQNWKFRIRCVLTGNRLQDWMIWSQRARNIFQGFIEQSFLS